MERPLCYNIVLCVFTKVLFCRTGSTFAYIIVYTHVVDYHTSSFDNMDCQITASLKNIIIGPTFRTNFGLRPKSFAQILIEVMLDYI